MKKDNSVKKDIGIAIAAVIAVYGILVGANYVDTHFGLPQVYTLVDVASLFLKVTTASAITFILKRLAFPNTLGKDFGDKFTEGWEQLTPKQKTLTTLAVFVPIFVGILCAG